MYLIRLDDASEYMDTKKWDEMEQLLDFYNVKPVVGIIPNNQDKNLINAYKRDVEFWSKTRGWQEKGWTIALHGYNHVPITNSGGINPVNLHSEFAGVQLKEQRDKIANGIRIFEKHGINAEVFFAPFHTFDMNTLEALRIESDVRVINDMIARDVYRSGEFYFIPQQSGRVRKLPFRIVTFCYHPNTMTGEDFKRLDRFIERNRDKVGSFEELSLEDRELDIYDKALRWSYFLWRSVITNPRGR